MRYLKIYIYRIFIDFYETLLYFLQSCKNPDSGIIGKCCRDPNYVDPWPTGNLPANYSGGFDEQGFPTFMNIVKVKLPVKTTKVPVKTPVNVEITKEIEPVLIGGNSDISSKKVYLVPPTTGGDDKGVFNAPELKLKCGIRNQVSVFKCMQINMNFKSLQLIMLYIILQYTNYMSYNIYMQSSDM